MALKRKVWTLLDVVLRVPPVFVMDAVLNSDLRGILGRGPAGTGKCAGEEDGEDSFANSGSIGLSLIWALFKGQAFLIALLTFLLSTKRLVSIYLRLLAACAILLSYKSNVQLVHFATNLTSRNTSVWSEMCFLNWEVLLKFAVAICLQTALATGHSLLAATHSSLLAPSAVWVTFLGPVICSHLPLPKIVLSCIPEVAATTAAALLVRNLLTLDMRIGETLYKGITWCHDVVEHYGLYTLLETHWINLHVPQVFRIYWLARMTSHFIFLFFPLSANPCESSAPLSVSGIVKYLVTTGSENFVALLGMTSVVSSLVQGAGHFIQAFLLLTNTEDSNIGSASAALFVILALQTGLTGLRPEKRFVRLCRNVCLLTTAILHFIHSKVNPLLLSLSASRNNSISKHCRAVGVCVFLVLFPAAILGYLWGTQSANSWLLAVTSFTVELLVNVLVSLAIYALHMIDAYRNGLWENLDDYVYYLRAFATGTEFMSGVFLFFNGAWIMLFESGGAIRACMICLHAYFNIWAQARAGWDVYLKRRSAVSKIDRLPAASEEQLRQLNDVCAICFQELNNARITRCNHYFHGICLRKWLNVQDSCPLCHTCLSEDKPSTER